MINLIEINKTLDLCQKKDFISFLKSHSSKKDLLIIKYYNLLSRGNLSAKEISKKIYGGNKKEAYHSLRKRLTKLLIDYIALNEIRNNDQALKDYHKFLIVSKKLIRNKVFGEGLKLLSKVEKDALEEDNYLFLNEVYLIQIQHSHYCEDNILPSLIKKFESNKLLLNQEINLQLAYAQVKNEIKKFLKEGTTFKVQNVIQNNYRKYEILESTEYNYKTLYQLGQIYYANALVLRDYHSIESYIILQYKTIFRSKSNKKGSLFYQAKLVYLLATLYFQRKEFKESEQYCKKLLSLIKNNNSLSIKAIEFKTTILFSLVNHYTGKQKIALDTLESYLNGAVGSEKIKLDALSVLTMFYFHKRDFKKVKNLNSQFQKTDNYYINLMGREWLMRKSLIEILLFIEIEEYDYTINKIRSFIRNNKQYLTEYDRVKEFLFLIKKICNDPNLLKDESFHNMLHTNLKKKPRKREDIYILSFFAWLKAKLENKNLYELTVELVNSLDDEIN